MWRCIQIALYIYGAKAVRIHAENSRAYERCQGYIISGGADLDPQLYNQENISSYNIESERDDLERKVISHALHTDKPLFGICRGAQIINVCLGGSLHQDTRKAYKGFLPTTNVFKKIIQRRKVFITNKNSLIARMAKADTISVNSIHHQSIDALGDGLMISAIDKFGVVQSIESNDGKTIWGVQWHPEFMLYSKRQRALFGHFIHCLSDQGSKKSS